VEAMRGREDECRRYADEAIARGLANGVGWAVIMARLGLAELELGLGNPREAIVHYEQVDRMPLPPMALNAMPDLIDAALRLGDLERARRALADFEAWCEMTEAPMALGQLRRCRAMLASDPDEADRLFEEALELHAHATPPFQRARTQLAYGEFLRREKRKSEARVQLRTAQQTFEGLNAPLWADRARGELSATGETARKRDPSTADELTPQERRIAELVATGASNREVGAALYVSPKTVEYHLRKVFVKLGVSSRVELARASLAAHD
jgi:DNA-binding CsgD family transcriptional regulator